jgi:iron only hydrogenase large subunit-like protein
MVRKMFPEFSANISVALTPMVLTARMIKKQHPGCKVVFVGPCDSKKLEASRKDVRSDVDFVLTFEEVLGMFEACGVEMSAISPEEEEPLSSAGGDARNFAVAGGVAQAVVNAIHSIDPTREVRVARADGLEECRKLLLMAKAGQFDGYLLEGMACPGGCVAGAGTLQPVEKSKKAVAAFADAADFACAVETEYKEFLPLIRE